MAGEVQMRMFSMFQFYLLKPDHVPKPEKEDISISGNRPDDEYNDDDTDNDENSGDFDNFTNQTREKRD